MKIRTGFVSNSSSSSFVLAVPKGSRKITLEIDLIDDIRANILESKKDIENYFLNRTECENLGHLKRSCPSVFAEYETSCEYLDAGKEILVGQLSSESENTFEQALYNHGIPLSKGMVRIDKF